MSTATHVSVEDLAKLVDKEATVHLIQEDGSTLQVTGTILAATAAGVPFKEKGKAAVQLLMPTDFYEAVAAPEKPKPIVQSKQKPVPDGQMRRHLAMYHGVSLSWCRENTEEAATEFHNTLDHADLGHKHVAEKAAEAAAPAAEGTPAPTESADVPY